MKNYVIGGSVIGFKYSSGICIATDTKLSYGSMNIHNGVSKLYKIDKNCLIAFSGEYSDIQYIQEYLKNWKEKKDINLDPIGYLNLIQKIVYEKRSNLDFLNVFCLVAGVDNEKVLGAVNLRGNFYFSDVVSSDLGEYFIVSYLRDKVEGKEMDIDKEEARCIAEQAMTMLYYRSARSSNNIQLAFVENDSIEITESYNVNGNWEIGKEILD